MKTLLSIAFATLVLLSGPGFAGEESAPDASAATVCEEPRPQVCTADYRPVCANLTDGSVKTYSNGCSACGDAKVKSWIEGECPE